MGMHGRGGGPEWMWHDGDGPGPRWAAGGRRVRRGHIRTAVLGALLDGPGHGYEIIQRLEEKSGGIWRSSPGSVCPTLQMLEDEGLVTSEPRDGKRVYDITDAGRVEASARAERSGGPPWAGEDVAAVHQLRHALGQLRLAGFQVAHAGQPEEVEQAVAVANDARRKLCQLLAEA